LLLAAPEGRDVHEWAVASIPVSHFAEIHDLHVNDENESFPLPTTQSNPIGAVMTRTVGADHNIASPRAKGQPYYPSHSLLE